MELDADNLWVCHDCRSRLVLPAVGTEAGELPPELHAIIGESAGAICHTLNLPYEPPYRSVIDAASKIAYDEDRYMSAWSFVTQWLDGTTVWRAAAGDAVAVVAPDGSIRLRSMFSSWGAAGPIAGAGATAAAIQLQKAGKRARPGPPTERDGDRLLQVIALKEEHLQDAAGLVRDRYRHLLQQEPLLPDRYAKVKNLLPLLQGIWNASGTGVAAIRGDRLVGFLTGWQMPSFRGKRSTYSPEWANAAELEDSRRIYEEMYSHLAAVWLAENYVAHYISLFPDDTNALEASHWMGFGMISVDAIRSLDSIQNDDADVQIRRADLQDLEQVMELHEALWQYMKGAPIFLLSEKRDRDYYEEWLQNPDKVVWLAYWNKEPVAFMRLGPADDDVCTIIYDEKTTSIYSAYTKAKARGKGIGTALLHHALQSARSQGYERCAVSFEPMNLLGTRFWLQYFEPVCYSVLRHIDDRLTQG